MTTYESAEASTSVESTGGAYDWTLPVIVISAAGVAILLLVLWRKR